MKHLHAKLKAAKWPKAQPGQVSLLCSHQSPQQELPLALYTSGLLPLLSKGCWLCWIELPIRAGDGSRTKQRTPARLIKNKASDPLDFLLNTACPYKHVTPF